MKICTLDNLVVPEEPAFSEDKKEKKKDSEGQSEERPAEEEHIETKKILKYLADTKKKIAYMKEKYADTEERFVFTVDKAREIIGYKVKTWKPPKWTGFDLWYASEEQSKYQQCLRDIQHSYRTITRYSYGSRSRAA